MKTCRYVARRAAVPVGSQEPALPSLLVAGSAGPRSWIGSVWCSPIRGWLGVSSLTAAVTLLAASQAVAQILPYNIGDAVRQSEETRRAAPQPRVGAPVLPTLVEPPFVLKDKEKLLVRRFKLDGPQLIDEAQVHALLAPYEGRSLTIAEIYQAADQITALYRNAGYLVAKAYVPAQNAKSGTLRIKVVPGKYGTVTLKNESLVLEQHMQGVLDTALAGETYVHKDRLERAMLLMSDFAEQTKLSSYRK